MTMLNQDQARKPAFPSDASATPAAPGRWTSVASLVLVLSLCSLMAACFLTARKKLFWSDELISFTLASDSSLIHMLRSLVDQVDGSPPLYHICSWCWARLFGANELSMRLLSGLAMCGAFYLTFRALRIVYGDFTALLATLSAFMLSRLVRLQIVEARPYCLLTLICAVAFFLFLKLLNSPPANRRLLLAANGLVHVGLVLSHNYGIFLSGAMLAGIILDGWRRRKLDIAAAGSVLLGWAAFIAWLPAFAVQARVGAEKFWIGKPTLDALFEGLQAGIYVGLVFLFLLVLWVAGHLDAPSPAQTAGNSGAPAPAESDFPVAVFVFALFLVPLTTFCASFVLKPFFHVRYLIPMTVGYSALFAMLFHRALRGTLSSGPRAAGTPLQRLAGTAMIIFLVLFRPVQAVYSSPPRPFTFSDKEFSSFGVPVVFELGAPYIFMHHYSAEPSRYFLAFDWPTALASPSIFSTMDYKLFAAVKRHYPAHQIFQTAEFLRDHDRFLVLDEEGMLWVQRNLEPGGGFDIRQVGEVEGKRLLLCERKKAAR